jgi:hypothetical protein
MGRRRRRKPAAWSAGKIALVLILAIALVAVTGLLLANLVFTVLIAIGSFTAGFLLGRSSWRSTVDLIPRTIPMHLAQGEAVSLVPVQRDAAITGASAATPTAPLLEAPAAASGARRRRSS